MYTSDIVDNNEAGIGKVLDGEIHDRPFNEFKEIWVYSSYYDISLESYKSYFTKNGKRSFVLKDNIVGRIMTREETNMPEERIVDIDLYYSEILIHKRYRLNEIIF